MKTKGTLVILTPGFAASEEDSTCLPMQQSLVRTLNELYPQLKVVVLSFQYPYRQEKYRWHKAVVYSFNGRNKGGFQRLWLRRKINKALQQIHLAENIVGLLSFWYGECAAVGSLFGRKTGIRHCCWLLGQDARKGNKYPRRYFLPPADMIALSDFIQDEFEQNYGIRPAHVVPPAVNPHHAKRCDTKKDIDVLAAGSLLPLKQYELFIEIVAQMKKTRPHVNAVLIGDGPEKQRLQSLIRQHSLQDSLELTGELSHEEVLRTMQRARVFLHPSSYEGFGVVCLEALYAGAEVISFVRPMTQETEGWHLVQTTAEMAQKAVTLLQRGAVDESRLPFHMRDTATGLLQLFEQGEGGLARFLHRHDA